MNFKIAVNELIGSYLKEFDFKLKNESETIIEFEHKFLVISFTYDLNSSFEVDVTFVPKDSNTFYSFLELKQFFEGIKNNYEAFQVTNEITLNIWIKEVKSFFISHLENIIKNPNFVFSELQKQSKKNAFEYYKGKEFLAFESEFNKLWNNKEYLKLIHFSDNNLKNVQGVFKKKYDYSKKIINKK